jgi:thymidylate kinase
MANSKLIIVEGAQGAGKTTVTDFLRYSMPHTNLYRLSGTSDKKITGLQKATIMYDNLLNYIETLQNLNINLVFDRTFFTEENYCRLGFKEYSFTEEYNKLVKRLDTFDFDIYYITLYLSNVSLFEERLNREGKVGPEYAKYTAESSINQQKVYLEMADELKKTCKNIKVINIANDNGLENLKETLKEVIE